MLLLLAPDDDGGALVVHVAEQSDRAGALGEHGDPLGGLRLDPRFGMERAGLGGFIDLLDNITRRVEQIGGGIVRITRAVAAAYQAFRGWAESNASGVCIADCGKLWIVDEPGGDVWQVREAAAGECQSRTTIPAANVPGWQSPCPSALEGFDLQRWLPWILVGVVALVVLKR